MSEHVVAIRLKIPDNEAFTALGALQRLGIVVTRLERADIWIFQSDVTQAELIASVKRNELLFNPNKHQLTVLEATAPRAGEVWVEELGLDPGLRARLGGKIVPGVRSAKRFAGWRLFDENNVPASAPVARSAADALLCNPAIERVFS
ncbi:MAG: hypothetical protein M3126_01385 [Candidatus Eremiobacteraeota bacterium]|nr:hypothetical protein [Candidatus Eremiobacteraeota bacterium]